MKFDTTSKLIESLLLVMMVLAWMLISANVCPSDGQVATMIEKELVGLVLG